MTDSLIMSITGGVGGDTRDNIGVELQPGISALWQPQPNEVAYLVNYQSGTWPDPIGAAQFYQQRRMEMTNKLQQMLEVAIESNMLNRNDMASEPLFIVTALDGTKASTVVRQDRAGLGDYDISLAIGVNLGQKGNLILATHVEKLKRHIQYVADIAAKDLGGEWPE